MKNLNYVEKKNIILPEGGHISFGKGWYEWEYEDIFPFRWMSKEANLFISIENLVKYKCLSFFLYSEFSDCSQHLSINLMNKTIASFALLHQWNYYSLSLPDDLKAFENQEKIEFALSLNKIFPRQYYPTDKRELGIRVARLELHNSEEKHAHFLFFHKNALLNIQETIEGKTEMSSYPLSLGIDLYGKCNIKPPCVYCLWDDMKKLEGKFSEIVIDLQTLKDYGNFFNCARNIVNCSIGEPFLHPKFEEILNHIDNQKKFLEISTNGLVFTNRTIEALLGKLIFLYVSLDAASKETYAKIRNDRFNSIIPQLYFLNQKRKKKENLPKIYMIFMPMKVNKDDLEDFFKLCRDIEADFLVLRPLNYLENPEIERDRGGYHFNYEDELLSWEELKEIFNKCSELSTKYGVKVLNQFYFGSILEPAQQNKQNSNSSFKSDSIVNIEEEKNLKENENEIENDLGHSKFPLCREPWQSYYILRRSILPCCHGSKPIAPMNSWAKAWNSPVLQEMRKYLREGRFSPYCRESLACPIVQRYCPPKIISTNLLTIKRYASLRFINRLFFRIPIKLYRFLRTKF
ncbi:MAG: radical SAM/SPASM domain-containing protein [Acidobacteriota bacterium]